VNRTDLAAKLRALSLEMVNADRYVRGNDLSPAAQEEAKRRFVYRWTIENEAQARRAHGRRCPTIPLISDAEWLRRTGFAVTKDGRLDNRVRFCHTHTGPDGEATL
jgi:hypothetical protein